MITIFIVWNTCLTITLLVLAYQIGKVRDEINNEKEKEGCGDL